MIYQLPFDYFTIVQLDLQAALVCRGFRRRVPLAPVTELIASLPKLFLAAAC